MKRTNYCGRFSEAEVGKKGTACGWVLSKRDMGGVIFVDLRDREGILQVVFDARNLSAEDFSRAETLRNQSVIEVSGEICLRDEETRNEKIPTGTIELRASKLYLLSSAEPLPFPIEEGSAVREEVRLKYRYLDIRRPEIINNLKFRHKLSGVIREYLDSKDFIEIETPILTKSTPEGARDYLVPSRVHPGSFYALPQSPQIFKQLLMVGGVDKYYQIARCFRDEDLRADRQPEFTQVDMEMSFIEQEDILGHLESLFKHLMQKMMNVDIKEPFPRITWHESMLKYGTDKPDIRFGLEIRDITDIAKTCNFEVFRKAVQSGGVVRAINVKNTEFTRSEIEDLTKFAIQTGAKGMAWIAIRQNGELYSILTKYFSEEELDAIITALDGKPGDFILFGADKEAAVCKTLGALRLRIGDMLGLRKKDDFKFLFITDFPQFEYSEEEDRYLAMHHPFTMPYEEDLPYLLSDPGRVRAQAYDVVLNGVELGSGSIRIHRSDVQAKMFEALGFSKEEAESRFGFMIGAFRYGTPPHGGFAFGLDRLAMLLLGAESLREIIAFPKNKDASCPMTNAPSPVDEKQLEELSLTGAGAVEIDKSQKAAKRHDRKINIDKLATLSRLSLEDEEKSKLRADLEAIVALADQLSAIDTENVKAKEHILAIHNVFREDVVIPSPDRDLLLREAPTKADGFITVPRVVN